MKEYIRVDNQIFFIILLLLLGFWPLTQNKFRQMIKHQEDFLNSNMGRFGAEDLI